MAQRPIHRMPKLIAGAPVRAERKRLNLPVGKLLVLLVLIFGAYWLIFVSDQFSIQDVQVAGISEPSVDAVASGLKGQNIFRVNGTEIEQDIRQVFPPTAHVELVRGIPHRVRLTIALREPALQWQVGDNIFVLDKNGEVFDRTKPEYASLPKVIDKSNRKVEVGQQVVTSAFSVFMTDLTTLIPEKFKRSITATEIIETTFHVDVVLDGDVRIRLTTQRPLQEQIDGAVAIWEAHPDAHLIDVRIPARGYYKK